MSETSSVHTTNIINSIQYAPYTLSSALQARFDPTVASPNFVRYISST